MVSEAVRADGLRARLQAGDTLVALFFKLAVPDALHSVALGGADVLIVDLEHSQMSEGEARLACRLADALGVAVVVRIPEIDRGLINRLLEAGATGIQLSTVTRVAQVEALVAASHYAPRGDRSFSMGHGQGGYGVMPRDEYLARQRSAPFLVAQVETAEVDDPVEDIAAAGADVVFVGTEDLRLSCEGRGLDPDERSRHIAKAVMSTGTHLGWFAGTDTALANARAVGARYVAVGADLGLLRAAVATRVAQAREFLGARGDSSDV